MVKIIRRVRPLTEHEKVALDHQRRGLSARASVERSANRHIIRGLKTRASMENQASKVFNQNETFFLTDNIYSDSDLNTARLIPKKSSGITRFILGKKTKGFVKKKKK